MKNLRRKSAVQAGAMLPCLTTEVLINHGNQESSGTMFIATSSGSGCQTPSKASSFQQRTQINALRDCPGLHMVILHWTPPHHHLPMQKDAFLSQLTGKIKSGQFVVAFLDGCTLHHYRSSASTTKHAVSKAGLCSRAHLPPFSQAQARARHARVQAPCIDTSIWAAHTRRSNFNPWMSSGFST